jgi:hypothetical protein
MRMSWQQKKQSSWSTKNKAAKAKAKSPSGVLELEAKQGKQAKAKQQVASCDGSHVKSSSNVVGTELAAKETVELEHQIQCRMKISGRK